ncbi:porphobilinogen synthase [Pontiella sulfatireligans]|uniref:Delta-aminolevulinic acid dehydratase n=1 Tax=Pontiella sulfatireligans TaxID=2750658 RepID=A0A6C2UQJ7_9BACT|nr:porphobilinogen synthase [Pontiella sulfatireligans]VGO22349.1 Delta-aminolevulinic acid dehydratase [Pontiella sulfatireligans]
MFPEIRLRRLRQSAGIRKMLDAPLPGPEKFMWPTFVINGEGQREPIDSMPGQSRLSVDQLLIDLEPVVDSGVGSVLLFGLADESQKDFQGTEAYNENGTVQRAIRAVKGKFPDLVVAADACVCAYTEHGHCGPLTDSGNVDNDAALVNLAKIAVSHAGAGADIVAPSSMMDGQVLAIRDGLDEAGLTDTILMSYSTKFASAMYGPFRDAEKSQPGKGDRKGYQASYRDLRTALRESELDEAEGADMLMVKPALFYLDVLAEMRASTDLPIAAYNVSGEYAMLHATADRGWGDLKGMVQESTAALVRAGADLLISYWANQYDELFKD